MSCGRNHFGKSRGGFLFCFKKDAPTTVISRLYCKGHANQVAAFNRVAEGFPSPLSCVLWYVDNRLGYKCLSVL